MNKVTIIGAGMVGATTAYSIVTKDIVEEIAIIDINQDLAEAQVMDLQHSVPFFGFTRVKVGTYEDCRDSSVVIVCAGVAQKVGETRLDLIKANSKITGSVVEEVFKYNPDTILIMVTNPVDILTYLAIRKFPDKKEQIFGTGTILDSARFRHLIGQKLAINPRSIHAYIVGEHGDSELPFWSTAMTGSMHLNECSIMTEEEKDEIFQEAKNSAYTIIKGKQATYYAIGAGTAHVVNAVINNKRIILPVSHMMEGEFGVDDVCLSVPAVIGREGIAGHVCIKFSEKEMSQLKQSADTLKQAITQLDKENGVG